MRLQSSCWPGREARHPSSFTCCWQEASVSCPMGSSLGCLMSVLITWSEQSPRGRDWCSLPFVTWASIHSHYVHLSVRNGHSAGGCEYWVLGFGGYLGGELPHAPSAFCQKSSEDNYCRHSISCMWHLPEQKLQSGRRHGVLPASPRGQPCRMSTHASTQLLPVTLVRWSRSVQGATWDLFFCLDPHPLPKSSHLLSFAHTWGLSSLTPVGGWRAFSW